MIDRVRPAQFTTTSVSGFGARSRTWRTSSAPGTFTPPGMFMRRYSANGRLSRIATERPASASAASAPAAMRGAPYCALDAFAERLARHVDPVEDREPRRAPRREAAGEDPGGGISEAAQPLRRTRGAVVRRTIVEQDGGDRAARQEAVGVELQPAQRQGRGEQRMPARVLAELARVEEGDLAVRRGKAHPNFRCGNRRRRRAHERRTPGRAGKVRQAPSRMSNILRSGRSRIDRP